MSDKLPHTPRTEGETEPEANLRYLFTADLLAQREALLQRLAGIDATLKKLGHTPPTPRRFRGNGEQARDGGG